MDVGTGLPATIPGVERAQLLGWARRAEARGFSSLGTIDYGDYDSLIALAAATAVTERIRRATAIIPCDPTPRRSTSWPTRSPERSTMHAGNHVIPDSICRVWAPAGKGGQL